MFGSNSAQQILVADDDDFVRRILKDFLSRQGYPVQLVSNGTEALKNATRTTYSLLILDLDMGRPTGLEVISKLRSMQNEVPAILMSGSFRVGNLKEVSPERGVLYLTKPFTSAELEKAVNGQIARTIALPCRHCGKSMAFPTREGVQTLRCAFCDKSTRVSATFESGDLRIRSEPE